MRKIKIINSKVTLTSLDNTLNDPSLFRSVSED